MDITVAISTERDQIFFCVVTQQASRAHVVDLETIGTPAVVGIALRPSRFAVNTSRPSILPPTPIAVLAPQQKQARWNATAPCASAGPYAFLPRPLCAGAGCVPGP